MSKILMNVTLFHTKLIVNSYTALTLPFYTIYQRPWQKLKLSRMMRVEKRIDKHDGFPIWVKKSVAIKSPYMKHDTYVQAMAHMVRDKESIGIRDVLEERVHHDEEGNAVVQDGKLVRKLVLADHYRWLTVAEVLERVDNIARGLYDLGVRKGDRIVIYADTQANWFFCSLAAGKLGAALVTLFSNLGHSGVVYGMNQTKAKYLITTQELMNKLATYIDELPHLEKIVYFEGKQPNLSGPELLPPSVPAISLMDLMATGAKLEGKVSWDLPTAKDVALIMYTSGTTSLPKAVIITHKQLMANMRAMTEAAEDNRIDFSDQTLASFLPLSHIFGYVFNIYMFINGARVGFATPFTLLNSSPSHVDGQLGDLRLLNPHTMIVVPLVLERFQKEIYAKLNKRGSLAAPLFTYFMDYKIRWLSRGFDTPIINKLICENIKREFGGNLEWMGCGGAALHQQIHAFTRAALNTKLMNAYGTTETCGGVYSMHIDDLSIGNCGVPFGGVKAKVVDWEEGGYTTNDSSHARGELVIGGDMVTEGYFENPEETAAAFTVDPDGMKWFYTGDIGEITRTTGSIRIIDRKKDLAKLCNGEYVSLGKIESGLRSSRYIENICICTDLFSNNLVALISPNRKVLRELGKSLGKGHMSKAEMCADDEITQIVLDSIKQTGQRTNLNSKEIPKRITLTAEEWLPDNNLLTAAFKLKRKHVYDFYEKDIQRMFKSLHEHDLSKPAPNSTCATTIPQ